MWNSILKIRGICDDMEEILLIKQDAYSLYELSEFKAKQELRKQYVGEGLNKSITEIVAIVLKVKENFKALWDMDLTVV